MNFNKHSIPHNTSIQSSCQEAKKVRLEFISKVIDLVMSSIDDLRILSSILRRITSKFECGLLLAKGTVDAEYNKHKNFNL